VIQLIDYKNTTTEGNKKSKTDLKIAGLVLLFAVGLGFVLAGAWLFQTQIAWALGIGIVLVAGNYTVKLADKAGRVFFGWLHGWQDYRIKRALADKGVMESQIITLPRTHGAIVPRDFDYKYHQPQLADKAGQMTIEQPAPEATPPNIIDVMRNRKHALAVGLAQQNGKTNTAAAIIDSWGIPIIWVGFRALANEHYFSDKMQLFIEEHRAGNIQRGVDAATKALSTPEPVTIMLDDLTNFGGDVGNLVRLIGTQAQAHNTRVVVTIHDLGSKSFGLDGQATLKNYFAFLDIPPGIKDPRTLEPVSFATIGTLYDPGAWQVTSAGIKGEGNLVKLPGRFVAAVPYDPDKQFKLDYSQYLQDKITQTEMIERYFGSKNGNTRQQFLDKAAGLGFPPKPNLKEL
jgi:hypothetical protein